MKTKRVLWSMCAALLLLISIRGVLAFHRFSAVEQNFDSIRSGDSRESVATGFGKPNYHAGPCSNASWDYPKGCTSEYVYSHPFAPLVPDYYAVWFSSDDRVIAADHLPSP
jgi:hypothetical protein